MNPLFLPFTTLEKFKLLSEDSFIATCPIHQEKTPSFRGRIKGNKLVLHCHGCHGKTDQFRQALGLSWSALFTDSRGLGRIDARKRRIEQTEREKLDRWRESELLRCAQELRLRDLMLLHASDRAVSAKTLWATVEAANEGYGKLEERFEVLRCGSREDCRALMG